MQMGLLKRYISESPSEPGVYMFKNVWGRPLYIGKASNLKARLSSYLKTKDIRVNKMLENAQSLKFIITDSDIEALILESQLIKKFRPQFNIVMRDDKQYAYVAFTNDEFSKIYITHQPQQVLSIKYKVLRNKKIHNTKYIIPNTEFVGPFTDASALRSTLKYLRKIFPFCTCKQPHNNYCLNYHIGKCLGNCCLKIKNQSASARKGGRRTKVYKEYKENIRAIKDILSGRRFYLIKDLEKEMGQLAKRGEFEKAIAIRQKLKNLKRVFENAKVIENWKLKIENYGKETGCLLILKKLKQILELPNFPRRIEGYDISNIQGNHAVGAMVTFISGQPDKKFYRKFRIYSKHSPDDTAMLREILSRRFNHPEWPSPDLIVVDGGIGQVNTVTRALKQDQIMIPAIGISKNKRHIGHQIVIGGKRHTIPLSQLPASVKNLLLNINSEAHRFAISYYRKRHNRTFMAGLK